MTEFVSSLRGVDIPDEFHSLPNFDHTFRLGDVPLPGQLIEVSRSNETTNRPVVSLLIGTMPDNVEVNGQFWDAVIQHDACAVISIEVVGGENVTQRSHNANDDQLDHEHLRSSPRMLGLNKRLDHREFHHFHWDRLRLQDKEVGLWSFTSWPTPASKRVVPIIPHIFLDFLRVVLQHTYSNYHQGRPLLIVGRSLDVPGLVAAIILLIHQACQEAKADVWKCVSYLRQLCGANVVSRFTMYEFIYDCLLQVMSATPTIMCATSDFAQMFRHLISRPSGDLFGDGNCFFDMGANRRVAPIKLQYAILRKLSFFYHLRLFPKETSAEVTRARTIRPTKRHQFAPKIFKTIWYSALPSYRHREHFLTVRGPVFVNTLLELMASKNSRTLIWFAETTNPADILNAGNNNHSGVTLSAAVNCGSYCYFTMSGPAPSKPWTVTVFHFASWPISAGMYPTVQNAEFLTFLRAVEQHAASLGNERDEDDFESTASSPSRDVVAILEAATAVSRERRQVISTGDTGCCPRRRMVSIHKTSVEGSTWRGVMAALVVYLDQRMTEFGEVDIYRAVQTFKMFDPFRVVISLRQYIWCFKMAWESCLLLPRLERERYVGSNEDHPPTSVSFTTALKNKKHKKSAHKKQQTHVATTTTRRNFDPLCCLSPCCFRQQQQHHVEQVRVVDETPRVNSSIAGSTPRTHNSRSSRTPIRTPKSPRVVASKHPNDD